jgi:hypothetical protein
MFIFPKKYGNYFMIPLDFYRKIMGKWGNPWLFIQKPWGFSW